MVHKICELCKTGTSSKWRTITLDVAQDVLDVFDIQLSVGKLICNACQIKLSKVKKKNESNRGQNERPSVPSRGEKYVTKANIDRSFGFNVFGSEKNVTGICWQTRNAI